MFYATVECQKRTAQAEPITQAARKQQPNILSAQAASNDKTLAPSPFQLILPVGVANFRNIIKSGHIEQTGALEAEGEHPDLPRLRFHFAKRAFGTLRRMIDRINAMPDDANA